jgi:hypothetical protein
MEIEETGQAIIVRDASSNQDAFRIAAGFGMLVVCVFGLLILAGWLFGGPTGKADDMTGILAAVLAVFAVIGLVALFDQRIECRFDLAGKRIAHVREYWFWPLAVRVWTRRVDGLLGEADGVGLAEHSSAQDGYTYKPVLTWGGRRLPLALCTGGYIGFDRKLDVIRAGTGLVKLDHG